MEKIEPVRRSVGDLENDFAKLLASRLPLAMITEEFERLWDEVNSAAASVISRPEVDGYIALLKRMQRTYESHCGASIHINGRRVTSRTR